MDIVKKNLKAVVAAFLGLFHFILLAIPFLGVFAEGMGQSETKNLSGYACFGETVSAMKSSSFLVFSQALFLIAAIALLLIGAYLLLVFFMGDKIKLPTTFGSVSAENLCSWVHMGYAIASILTFLAVVSVTIANTSSAEFMGVSVSAGVRVGFGVILGVLLAAGSVAGLWFVEKKNLLDGIGGATPKTRFVCSKCGESAAKGSAFCPKCGGQVVEVVPTKLVCSSCGAPPARKGDAFCSKCGGKIEEITPTKPVCEACGEPADNGTAFCPKCGGKIVQK